MAYGHRAGLEFTFSRPTTDPQYMPEIEGSPGSWLRFQRIMERDIRPMPFMPFQDAPIRVKNLAVLLDDMLDSERWIGVQVLPGLYEVFCRTRQAGLAGEVNLILLGVDNTWQPPTCHLELDSDPRIRSDEGMRNDVIAEMLHEAPRSTTYKSVEVFAVSTEERTLESITGAMVVEPFVPTPA